MVKTTSKTKNFDIQKLEQYVELCKSKKFDEKSIHRRLEESSVPKEVIEKLLHSISKDQKEDNDKYDRNADAISHEEMNNIEKKEMNIIEKIKKTISDKKIAQKETDSQKEEHVDSLSNIQLSRKLENVEKKIENINVSAGKMDGKIDLISGKSDTSNEELENASEKIGELRSTIMSRERLFNKLEDDMSSVKYIVNSFKPEQLEKKFNDVEVRILKMMSSIEKDETKEESVEKELKLYEDIMAKIKNYDSILMKLEDLKKTEKKIEKMKFDVEKMNSKIEVLYRNIEDSIGKINVSHDIALNNQSTMKEILVSISKNEQRLEMLTKKEEFNQLNNDVHLLKKSLFLQEFDRPKKKGLFKK